MSSSLEQAIFECVICVPVCDELDTIEGLFVSIAACNQSCVVVLVVNHRSNADFAVKQRNYHLLKKFGIKEEELSDGETWIEYNGLTLLVIDHASPGREFGQNQGVGLARKIAADRALALINSGQVSSPWIRCTDGDALVPECYLEPIPYHSGTAIFPWKHIHCRPALQLYELSLRCYTLGLHYAQSPYSFPTIGSTICIHKETYKAIYGFSDRMAGEDFYLLNKAAKVAPIYYLDRGALRLRDRDSIRVPFGTGPAVRAIINNGNQRPTYHPELFEQLRGLNALLFNEMDEELLSSMGQHFKEPSLIKRFEKLLRQGCHQSRIIRRRFELFDAFRTMRLLHHWRDQVQPVEIRDAIHSYAFLPSPPAKLEEWCEWIEEIERERLVGKAYGLTRLEDR